MQSGTELGPQQVWPQREKQGERPGPLLCLASPQFSCPVLRRTEAVKRCPPPILLERTRDTGHLERQ